MRDTGAVELDTKVCPRCGELLFADMDVCYGCLYDFTRKRPRPLLPDPPRIDADDIPVEAVQACAEEPMDGPSVSPCMGDDLPVPSSCPDETAVLSSSSLGVLVRTNDVDVCVPLPRRGLMVGRGLDCDVVLHADTVSRHHLAIAPTLTGAVISDLGATNPASAHGAPVEGNVSLGVGESVFVCGTELVIVDRARDRPPSLSDTSTSMIAVPPC